MKKFIQLRIEFVIPILFAILIIPLSYFHTSFEEWDGVMQVFAGRAIFSGQSYAGWTSHYWPPLYSLLVGFLQLFMSGFLASKLISLVAGVLLLYVAYKLAIELTQKKVIALLTQLFLVVNPLFLLLSIQAENNMLDSLFFVSSILLLLQSLKVPESKRFIVLGLIAGLAGLSRYTSYTLVPLVALTIFIALDWRKALKPLFWFALSFSIVSLPWWIMNTIQSGSPFATWQYLNIGYGVFDLSPLWWWNLHANYNGIGDIILANPGSYDQHVLYNLWNSLLLLLKTCVVLSPFVIPAWIGSWFSIKRIYWVSLVTGLCLYFLLVSQAFVFAKVFLSWTVISTILSIDFISTLLTRYERHHRFLTVVKKWLLPTLLCFGFMVTFFVTYQYIQGDSYDDGELADQKAITQVLKAYDPNIEHKTIMAVHPARAYYLGTQFLMIPLYYEGNVEGINSYKALDEKVIQHAPNSYASPLTSPVKSDYLIYDRYASKYLPQFSFLFDPNSAQVPSNFKLVYQSNEAVVYEIEEVPSQK
ncbi:ArnT family glycosyltransferase [Ectobacillus polymachus]|uniref:ArnT family glycosyltransferase n=1 Tax=Ectobacillus polymachus TaxID=1508806 RepID=UPI003A8BCF76